MSSVFQMYTRHHNMESSTGCYCCRNAPQPTAMDLDTALNELGMLAAVTESRRQYLHERSRSKSESQGNDSDPSLTNQSTGIRIINMNPQYVVGVSTGSNIVTGNQASKHSQSEQAGSSNPLGSKYSQDSLESDARASRVARVKLSRIKRFRKPYVVPWRLRNEPDLAQNFTVKINCKLEKSVISSNTSTPEKLPQEVNLPLVTRSKSLDDLDLSKLQIAEAEKNNYIIQKKEIETMSQNLKDLQVGDAEGL